jgi:hypothetical protein
VILRWRAQHAVECAQGVHLNASGVHIPDSGSVDHVQARESPAMTPQPRTHPPLHSRLISRAQARELLLDDGKISGLVRAGAWQRVHPEVFATDPSLVSTPIAAWPFEDRLTAARLHLGSEAIVYGASAARLWGIEGVWRKNEIVELALPRGHEQRQRDDYVLHTVLIDDDDIVSHDGALITSPIRTVTDLILRLPRQQSVSVVDSALNRGLLTRDDFGGIVARTYRRRGARRARLFLTETDERSQSPVETSIRLVLTDAGLAPDALQIPVLDASGRVLGYGDMGYDLRSRGLERDGFRWAIIEADGREIHDRPQALFRDRRRSNDFHVEGRAKIVRFTSDDLRHPAYIVTTVQALLAS